jgi:hypothetical protein
MFGIRIKNKYDSNPKKVSKDYEFCLIVNVIQNNIRNLYWILDNRVLFNNFSKDGDEFLDYQEKYDDLIVAEKENCRLANIDFLLNYSKFIFGDWDHIYGITNKEYFQNVDELDTNFVKDKATIFFRCIDGVFWEIYAKDKIVIDKIAQEFPHSENCTLKANIWM